MKRLLVTGASGYLGSHLVWANGDWEICGTHHVHPPTSPNPNRSFQCDLRDASATRTLLLALRPLAIIHAALSNNSSDEVEGIPLAARNVARAARELGARLVHLSTDLIWDGDNPPYSADSPPSPLTDYARAKAEAETIVRDLFPSAAIVRPSLIWGLDPLDKQTRWLVEGIQEGRRVTLFTDEFRQPVYVHSLVAALLEFADRPELSGPFNMGGAQRLSRWDFGQRLIAALRRLRPELVSGPGEVIPGLAADSSPSFGRRARDLTMVMDETHRRLRSHLPGVDEVIESIGSGFERI